MSEREGQTGKMGRGLVPHEDVDEHYGQGVTVKGEETECDSLHS